MIDLHPYLEQLSKEDLKQIGKKYKIEYVRENMNIDRLRQIIYSNLSREKLFVELFKTGRSIKIKEEILHEITDEFHISDRSYSYLLKRTVSSNPRIRANAIKGLINNHPGKSLNIVADALLRENSVHVLANTWRDLESSKFEEYQIILNTILKNCSQKLYNLVPNEVRFWLDYAKQFVWSPETSFEEFFLNNDMLGADTTTVHYKYIFNNLRGNDLQWVSFYRNHVSGIFVPFEMIESIPLLRRLKLLWISGYVINESQHKIPLEISELKSLKYLYLENLNLHELPEFLGKLPKLRYLSLRGTNINFIPQWVKDKAKKYHSRAYKREGVADNDAYVLGLLEILLGEKMDNLDTHIKLGYTDEENITHHGAIYYRMNEIGRVTEIIIDEAVNGYDIRIIPEELMSLDALEKLHIQCRYLRVIPNSVLKKFPHLGSELCLSLIDEIVRSEFLERDLYAFMETIESVYQYNLLFRVATEWEWIKRFFPAFLKLIDKLHDRYKYTAFSRLIKAINNTEILKKYYSQIETKFFALLNNIDKLHDRHQYHAFSALLSVGKIIELLEEHFPVIFKTIDKLHDSQKLYASRALYAELKKEHFPAFLETIDKLPNHDKQIVFSELLKVAKGKGWMEEVFLAFLGTIDKLHGKDKGLAFSDLIYKSFKNIGELRDKEKYLAFYKLIDNIRDTELIDKYSSLINIQFLALVEGIDKLPGFDKYKIFSHLIDTIKNTKILNKYFSQIKPQFRALMESIDNILDEHKYPAFSELIHAIRDTELMNEFRSLIESQFLRLLEGIDEIPDKYKYIAFSKLLEVGKITGLINKHFSVLLGIFPKLPDFKKLEDHNKYIYFSNLMMSIRGTDLDKEIVVKKWKEQLIPKGHPLY